MLDNKKVVAIIPAAGKGSRMGSDIPKQFMMIDGMPMIAKTFKVFAACEIIDEILVVTGSEQIEQCKEALEKNLSEQHLKKLVAITEGGSERQESVFKALKFFKENFFASVQSTKPDDKLPYIVLIHDGARPYVTADIIENTVRMADKTGGAVVCVKTKDTIRTAKETLDRDKLMAVQTPQGFKFDLIYRAHEAAVKENFSGTDDAGLYERMGYKLSFVEGSYENIKITTPEDLPMDMRIGNGFDVHRLVEGRKCIIGGVDIPYEKGLLGHSDADVLAHAITDAILGAANLGDIGKLFPDTDPAYEGADSLILMSKVAKLMEEKGYQIGNLDAVVMCERPKIGPHREQMAENIAKALNTQVDRISIKATTTEKLGFTGRGEGIAAQAVVLLQRKN